MEGSESHDQSAVKLARMSSVITQQSETTCQKDNADEKQEPSDKLIEEEAMEHGKVRFVFLSLHIPRLSRHVIFSFDVKTRRG